MIICKNLNVKDTIKTVDEWFQKCPPQKGIEHWKDGRSAKETAKTWINGIPQIIKNTLNPLNFSYDIMSPEYKSHFDDYGNPRNHDLLLMDSKNKILVGIESKVSEPFGNDNVENYFYKMKNKLTSKLPTRITILKKALFAIPNSQKINPLMYQLLTAVAGTLAEAGKLNCKKAVFLIQTFLTNEMDSKKHHNNGRALDEFLNVITDGKHQIIHNGDLINIGKLPGNTFIPKDIELYIAKCDIRIKPKILKYSKTQYKSNTKI